MVQRVMAVDPGKSTGIVVGDFHDDHEFSIIHVQQLKHEHWMSNAYDILATHNEYAPDVTVCEQFDLRPGNNFLADLTPVKIQFCAGMGNRGYRMADSRNGKNQYPG